MWIKMIKRLERLKISFLIILYFVCEAIGIAATPGLLCQPRVIVKMIVEKQMECRLAGETEVLGENLAPAPLLSITKSHMTRLGFEPGRRGVKPAAKRLSYGAARKYSY
jgi:hypothetical protein